MKRIAVGFGVFTLALALTACEGGGQRREDGDDRDRGRVHDDAPDRDRNHDANRDRDQERDRGRDSDRDHEREPLLVSAQN